MLLTTQGEWLPRHYDLPPHRQHGLIPLVDATVFNGNNAAPIVEIALLQDGRLGVNRVAMKHRPGVPDFRVFQSFERAAADVRLAHADHETDHDGPFHQPAAMLRSRRKILVNVQRMLVHAQKTEQRVVELGDGAAGPMPEGLSRLQFVEVASVVGGLQITKIAWARGMRLRSRERKMRVQYNKGDPWTT
jgi:hypothetical protein